MGIGIWYFVHFSKVLTRIKSQKVGDPNSLTIAITLLFLWNQNSFVHLASSCFYSEIIFSN